MAQFNTPFLNVASGSMMSNKGGGGTAGSGGGGGGGGAPGTRSMTTSGVGGIIDPVQSQSQELDDLKNKTAEALHLLHSNELLISQYEDIIASTLHSAPLVVDASTCTSLDFAFGSDAIFGYHHYHGGERGRGTTMDGGGNQHAIPPSMFNDPKREDKDGDGIDDEVLKDDDDDEDGTTADGDGFTVGLGDGKDVRYLRSPHLIVAQLHAELNGVKVKREVERERYLELVDGYTQDGAKLLDMIQNVLGESVKAMRAMGKKQ